MWSCVEKEIRNYIKCLNLIIIKAKYNIILKKFFDNIKQKFDEMKKEINTKLNLCEEIRFMTIEDIRLYLEEDEENKKETTTIEKKSKIIIDSNRNRDNDTLSNDIIEMKESITSPDRKSPLSRRKMD